MCIYDPVCVCVCTYVLCAEAKQQMSLTEWCEVKAGVSPPETQRNWHSAGILQDAELLDNGGDSVFNQMVISPAKFFFFQSVNKYATKVNHDRVCLQSEKDATSLEPWLLKEMDTCISSVFLHQDADAFVQLFNLIVNENISGTVFSVTVTPFKSARSTSVLTLQCQVNVHVFGFSCIDFSGLQAQRNKCHPSDGGCRERLHQPDGAASQHGGQCAR